MTDQRKEHVMNEAEHLAERYVAVWNEPDPQMRRNAIAALWVPDGIHYVKTREARGYAALEERIVGSHEKNVREGGYRFRTAGPIQALRNVVTFDWEMVPAGGGEVAASGVIILIVDPHDRILTDYQFVAS